MRSINKNKGFTLIELIAVLVILAIILAIAVPSITGVIKSAKNKACIIDAGMMEKAAKTYVQTEDLSIPKGETRNISLDALLSNKFISPVLDPSDRKTPCEGYVVVTNTDGIYTYRASLKCSNTCQTADYNDGNDDNTLPTDLDTVEKNGDQYFEGANPNNWVKFGRMDENDKRSIMWRIIKVDKTGIKMVYEGNENALLNPLEDGRALIDGTMGIPWDNQSINKWNRQASLVGKLDEWLSRINVVDINQYIEPTQWKIGGVPYEDPTNLQTFLTYQDIDSTNTGGDFAGLTNYVSPIGMINAVDFMYTSDNGECMNSYKETGSDNECAYNPDGSLNNFLQKDKYHYWTLNARSDSSIRAWNITNSGLIGSSIVNLAAVSVRPILNLKLDTTFIAGSGTIDDPYILEPYMIGIWDAPTITLTGDNPTYVRQYDEYVDEGATAYDEQDGDISEYVQSEGSVNTSTIGEYEIAYNVKDSDGNEAIPVTRTVVVVDRDTPLIKLNGDNPMYVTITKPYVEPGATAYDINYGDISSDIVITGTVDVNTLGTYYIKYNVTNEDGVKAPEIKRAAIVGTPIPTITLNGPNLTQVDIGKSYEELGATATDELDGDLTYKITSVIKNADGEQVNRIDTDNLARYTIRYSVTNSFGANAYVDRTVDVVSMDGPEITYTPDGLNVSKQSHETIINVKKTNYDINQSSLKYFIFNQYTRFTAKDFDSYFTTPYTNGTKITIKGGTANYYVYAIAKDTYGNARRVASKAFRLDNSNPVITMKPGVSRILLYKPYIDPGATATDKYYDGDITSKITSSSTVNSDKAGTYKVTYEVSDSAGNKTTADRSIEVYNPTPEIFLKDGSKIELLYGNQYIEPGATATDEIDGDLTDKIKITGTVNEFKEGIYEIKYEVTNSLGLTATRIRTVHVYIPLAKITILGDNPVRLLIHSQYSDAGATAMDELDGDLTSKIITEGTVNVNVAGTYKIKYSVTNNLGKIATAERTVTVYIPKPVITLNGNNPITLIKTQMYIDQGATATDELDGNLTSKIITEGTVNAFQAGEYQILYRVTNSEGGYSEAKRKVIVRNSLLSITLNGDNPVELIKGAGVYYEKGCTAFDELDGDLTNNVQIIPEINPSKAGTYKVTYSVTNSGGDTLNAYRTVTVRDPKVEIKLNGESYIELPIGAVYVDEGATATDELLGDVTDKIISTPDLNPNVLGTYHVNYEVTSSGVTASATRTIKVIPLEGPAITFNPVGESTWAKQNQTVVTISKSKYNVDPSSFRYFWKLDLRMPKEDAFASANAFASGDVIKTPVGESGRYYLFVLAKDIYGNTSIMGSNGFNVDNTVPVLTLIGNKVIESPVDGTFKDPGVTVLEVHSGLDSKGIVITSNIVPGVIGTYTVTYNATDKVGNKAATITRTVSVVEASLRDAPDGEDYKHLYDSSYFVGANPNNWIEFGNAAANFEDYIPIMWRIIKADDNGIKIIYAGVKSGNTTAENGTIGRSQWDTDNNTWNRPASVRNILDNFYNNLNDDNKDTLTSKINWCVGKTSNPFGRDNFKIDECKVLGDTKSAVGLVSGLDYILTSKDPCDAYNQASCGTNNFLKKDYSYYTISTDATSNSAAFIINTNGGLTREEAIKFFDISPVINLKADVLILGGEGTFNNPYKLNTRVPTADNIPPTIKFNPSTADGKVDGGIEVVVTDDLSGVDNGSLKYLWTTIDDKTDPTADMITNSFDNGFKIPTPSDTTNTYYLWVVAKDKKANQKVSKGGPYTIDNDAPIITVNGTSPYYVAKGGVYRDLGATAIDNKDGAINVTVESNVNPSILGTYQIIYTAKDKAGNIATATRTVEVIEVGGEFDPNKGMNAPILLANMTPIRWIGTSEMLTSSNDNAWYDYAHQIWANARTDDGSYWVWIPRFAYQITSNYHKNIVGGINIKFLADDTNIMVDGGNADTTPTYSGGVQTNYVVAPAFTYGDKQLTGIWVSKFEASGVTDNIRVLPNVKSLTSLSANNIFTATYDMRNNPSYGWELGSADTHMMRNSEWSAVALLSKSSYGKNTEIWNNNSSTLTTGCAGNVSNEASYAGCKNAYNTTNGYNASSTGTIYGVYDIAGGASELVAAYVNNGNAAIINNGASIVNANVRYKDVFNITTDSQANNYNNSSSKFGQAIYETSSSYSGSNSWFNDYSNMPTTTSPWFSRGGLYSATNSAGAFSFEAQTGAANASLGFRPVIAADSGPTVKFTPNGITTRGTSIKVLVTADNGLDISSLRYLWTTTKTEPSVAAFTTYFDNGTTINTPDVTDGTYYLWIYANDNTGNNTIVRSQAVTVDTVAPIITLKGISPLKHKLNTTYIDPGYTVTDNVDTDIKVTIQSDLNPSLRGTYTITYTATDDAGNSNSVSRTVIVDVKEIRTAQDLYNIRNDISADYIVMNNIDMANSEYASNFPVIPDFSGTLDGQGYKILNLKINSNGLFTRLHTGAQIYDIEFVNFDNQTNIANVGSMTGKLTEAGVIFKDITLSGGLIIKGTNSVGGLIGEVDALATLKNIYVNGTITGTSNVGGLIGYTTVAGLNLQDNATRVTLSGTTSVGGLVGYANTTTTVTGSYTAGTITSTSNYTGGLVGYEPNGTLTISNSYSSMNITSTSTYVGGLAGAVNVINMTTSYASGNVKGVQYVGGLVGSNNSGTISKCYASGNVESTTTASSTAYASVGGLVAWNNANIQDAYAAGNVKSAGGYSGGIVGVNRSGTITRTYLIGDLTNAVPIIHFYYGSGYSNNYWIGETTGVYSGSYGTLISSIQEATNSAEYVGFDFTNVWGITYGESTPYLRGMMIAPQNYLENHSSYNGEGSGSIEDPYLVKTPQDLYNIRNQLGMNYKLANDIDMSGSAYENNFPIIIGFNATLDGDGHKISNLKLTNGLFTNYDKMTVKNLTLENVTVSATSNNAGAIVSLGNNVTLSNIDITGTSRVTSTAGSVGGLVGYTTGTLSMSNVTSTATISGTTSVGGLVGYANTTTTVTGSYTAGTITSTSNYTGGLVGYEPNGTLTISNSYSSMNITSTSTYVGGLAGYVNAVNITTSYASGNVKGVQYVGGLVGSNNSGTISKCYSSGNIESTTTTSSARAVGGLVGSNSATIQDTYSTGKVTSAGGYSGGLVGYNNASISRSYVMGLLTRTNALVGYAAGSYSNNFYVGATTGVYSGTGATLINTIVDATNSIKYSTFDFYNVWDIDAGHTTPFLRNLAIPGNIYIN